MAEKRMYRGYDSRYYSGQRPKPKAEPEPKSSKPELEPERGKIVSAVLP